ncbi:MAG: methyltransferase domain-containing protein [Candidatus Omnitrophica bacterium]|nr:methyltransferase domain-containing protein [Candidatus Omnitrophota bacterium]
MSLARPLKSLIRAPLKLAARGLEKGAHITRYYMYGHLTRLFRNTCLEPTGGVRVLSVSGSLSLCGLLNIHEPEIVEINYPEHDLLDLDFPGESFEYVVCDQVLEHVEGNPQKAVNEVHRVLKPGGIAVLTSCLINPVHKEPSDLWRFTPDGLKFLFGGFSDIIEAQGWGNRVLWLIDWIGMRYDPVPHAAWHPLHKIAMFNDPNWPVVTWIIARK